MAIHAQYDIGFDEALVRTLRTLTRLAPADVPISEAEGLVVAEDCTAKVDCPSSSVSRKDGYAVVSTDLIDACDSAVKLRIVGRTAAGVDTDAIVRSGTAVRITSGARIPPGADAVIASKFTRDQGQWVPCHRAAGMQRNIRERGYDVRKGSRVAVRGETLAPARTGLMAAGGIATVRVYPRPRIGVIATGHKIVVPGQSLKDGQVYASNVITLHSWLRHFHMDAEIAVVADDKEHLAAQAAGMLEHVDVLITSGAHGRAIAI
jgi:molybdopterin molybdotransferase